MKRPMCVVGFSLVVGTWAAFYFAAQEALLLSAAALATGLLFVLLPRRRPWRVAGVACILLAAAFALQALREERRIAPFEKAEGETIAVTGFITKAVRGRSTAYYTLDATFPDREDLPDSVIRIRCYGEMEYLQGEAVSCEVQLAPKPQEPGAPRHAPDTFLEGIAIGNLERVEGGYTLRRAVYRLRGRMQENLYANLREPYAGLLSAMVLGLRDSVDSDTYAVVNRAGTVHLLAVSGLHLSILTALAAKLLERLRVPRRMRALLLIAAAGGVVLLVGASASIVRAFTMTAVALAAGLSRRKNDPLSALGFAVGLLCILRPHWVLGRGLWLSAAATLGILLCSGRLAEWMYGKLRGKNEQRNRVVRMLAETSAVGIAAYLFTLPFLLLFYGWIPLLSPLANLLITPFVPVIIGGGMLLAAAGNLLPVRVLSWLVSFCMETVLQISEIIGSLPLATFSLEHTWQLFWLACVVLVLILLAAFRADRRMAGAAAMLLAVAFCAGHVSAQARQDSVELATIENCSAAVLLYGEEAVILGTPAYYEVERLLRYLEYRGVRQIRAVVAADCGEQVGSGLPRLASRYPVDCVLGPDDAYITGEIAAVLPGVPVYPGGYATLSVLGVDIGLTVPEGDIFLRAGNNTVLKSGAKYAIIKNDTRMDYTIGLYPDDIIVLHGAAGQEPTPVGTMLYGEKRFRLHSLKGADL